MNRWPAMIVLGLLAVTVTGCGYTAGGPYRSDIETVHVEMFGSREFRRGIEFELTEAVQKRIATDTPYRLAPKNKADTVLRGEILEVEQAAWAPDSVSRLPRERQLTLAIRVQWQDLRSGKLLLDRPVELRTIDYVQQLGESEAYALQRVTDKMAEKITKSMYDEW